MKDINRLARIAELENLEEILIQELAHSKWEEDSKHQMEVEEHLEYVEQELKELGEW